VAILAIRGRYSLTTPNNGRVVEGREEGIDVDSFVEANMTESNPVLSESIVRDHDQLTLDVFVCFGQLSLIFHKKGELTIAEHPRSNMSSAPNDPSAFESLFCSCSDFV